MSVHPYVLQLDAAATVNRSTNASINYTLHTCQNLLKQAVVYERESRYEHAYVMYKRFVKYYIENVSKHPNYPTHDQQEKDALRSKIDRSIDRLADLRMLLNDKYSEIDRQATAEVLQQQASEQSQRQQAAQKLINQPMDQSSLSSADIVPSSDADIALEARLQRLMATNAEEEQSNNPPINPSTAFTNQNIQSNPTYDQTTNPSVNQSNEQLPDDNYPSLASAPPAPGHDASDQPTDQPIIDSSSATNYTHHNQSTYQSIDQSSIQPIKPSFNLPSAGVPPLSTANKWSNLYAPPQSNTNNAVPFNQPLNQPTNQPINQSINQPQLKQSFSYNSIQAAGVPQYQSNPSVQPVNQAANQPVNQSFVQRMFGTKPSLRPLVIPASLMQQFMQRAMSNTLNNLETCAVLCGQLRDNSLTITHCIFPPQNATADTCVTHDEEALLNVQTKLDLLTLGWIHTHPSQSCFLSSIDLHTQYSYQLMMSESVAIVCAPSQAAATKHEGIFSINEQGMKLLANCRMTGFHQHAQCEDGELYGDAQHIRVDPRLQCEFIDLRPKTAPTNQQMPHSHQGHSHQHQPIQNQYFTQPRQPIPHIPMGPFRRGF